MSRESEEWVLTVPIRDNLENYSPNTADNEDAACVTGPRVHGTNGHAKREEGKMKRRQKRRC